MAEENTNASTKAIEAQGAKTTDLSGSVAAVGNIAPVAPSNKAPDILAKTDDEVHGVPDPKAEALKQAKEEEAKAGSEDEDDDEQPDEWNGEYVKLGDSAGESVINLLKEAKVSAREANLIFAEAIAGNDLTKIKWDVLEEKLGKDKANLAKIGITDYYTRIYSDNVKTTEKAYEVVGGEENWKSIATWVKKAEKADPKRKAEFDEIRKGIDVGGRIAILAVNDLKSLYEADPKNNGLGVKKLTTGQRVVETTDGTPLSRADYLTAVKEAHEKNSPKEVISSLQRRRQAGMAQGLR